MSRCAAAQRRYPGTFPACRPRLGAVRRPRPHAGYDPARAGEFARETFSLGYAPSAHYSRSSQSRRPCLLNQGGFETRPYMYHEPCVT
jgi:hypothetical protein